MFATHISARKHQDTDQIPGSMLSRLLLCADGDGHADENEAPMRRIENGRSGFETNT